MDETEARADDGRKSYNLTDEWQQRAEVALESAAEVLRQEHAVPAERLRAAEFVMTIAREVGVVDAWRTRLEQEAQDSARSERVKLKWSEVAPKEPLFTSVLPTGEEALDQALVEQVPELRDLTLGEPEFAFEFRLTVAFEGVEPYGHGALRMPGYSTSVPVYLDEAQASVGVLNQLLRRAVGNYGVKEVYGFLRVHDLQAARVLLAGGHVAGKLIRVAYEHESERMLDFSSSQLPTIYRAKLSSLQIVASPGREASVQTGEPGYARLLSVSTSYGIQQEDEVMADEGSDEGHGEPDPSDSASDHDDSLPF